MVEVNVKGVLLAIISAVLLDIPALAGWNIRSGEKYYITCNYRSGFISIGAYQDSPYEVYYQTNSTIPTSDGYWYIENDGGGYTFQNCETGQFLSWTSVYNDYCKYLTFVNEVSSDDQRWTLTQGSGFISIRSVSQPNYQFNLRTSTYLLGCYSSYSTDNNEQFNIYDSDGYAIEYVEVEVKVESVVIEAEKTELEKGEMMQLTTTILPEDATDTSVTWTSSDETVASVSRSGWLEALSGGETLITATAHDGSGAQDTITIRVSSIADVSHSEEFLYVRRSDSTMVVIPNDYVVEHTFSGSLFNATLIDGEPLELKDIVEVRTDAPDDVPAFSSYKFNNKYNSQVFTDAECDDPSGSTIYIKVGCIGKWLTASFQFTTEGTKAWVNGVRQRSKETRQSFANPVTYELTNSYWQELVLKLNESDNTFTREYTDFSRQVTVDVRFLSDYSTSEYKVPRIDITLSNTGSWSSSNWIGMHGKTYYEDAVIAIDGVGVYPDLETTPIQIKGRGNTSWSSSYTSKNPYHFKFEEKQKPLGMKNGKHWILLSNKQKSSMTTNAMGHKVGNLLAAAGTNHIVPVELYINGSYRGSYNLTERIGFSNNSIDLEDESCAAMIELDTYTDETIYSSNAYQLPAKIHKPDLEEDDTQLTSGIIIDDFNSMVAAVNTGTDSFLHQVDPDYLARYLLVCECIVNCELKHPKSAFLYSENVTDGFDLNGDDETPWIYGPLWDCDWAFGYENYYGTYYVNDAQLDFFDYLARQSTAGGFWKALRYNATEVDKIYYTLMYDFVNNGSLDELVDYCDEYYDFASASFDHNNKSSEASERDGGDYATITSNSKSWFTQRANYILSQLTPYEIDNVDEDDDSDLDDPVDRMGDVNDDGGVGVADLVCILNYMLGIDNETFIAPRADVNSDGEVSVSDVVMLCDVIMSQVVDINRNLHMPAADITMQMQNTECEKESVGYLPVSVCVDEGSYSALQMDLRLPDGVELDGVELPTELDDMTVCAKLMDGGKYRIVVYADGNHLLPDSLVVIQLRVMTGEPVSGYASITGASASTSQGEEERLSSIGCTFTVTDVASVVPDINEDSSRVQEESSVVYDLSGRIVSTRQMEHQRGVYIINGKKVVR